jgi:hypothetical protein
MPWGVTGGGAANHPRAVRREKLACRRIRLGLPNARADNAAMGIRTRGLDISINARQRAADSAARAEAKGVIDRWNEQLAAGREMLWSPTIRAALIAGTPWLDVYCPGCGTSRALDLRKVDRHPLGLQLIVVDLPLVVISIKKRYRKR